MREGGRKLAAVKQTLIEAAKIGVSFEQLEAIAQKQISKRAATPSFSTVKGYDWATCITKNEGCCHGVPRGKKVEDGDVITIDVGLVWQGFHVDTTATFYVGTTPAPAHIARFLEVGSKTLEQAIDKARLGNTVYDISKTIEQEITAAGYSPVYQLTGHTIGRNLHEDPQIPCVAYKNDKKHKLYEGQTIAVEVMYAEGEAYLVVADDGWTYETRDKSLSGMFEETVLITIQGPEVLTR